MNFDGNKYFFRKAKSQQDAIFTKGYVIVNSLMKGHNTAQIQGSEYKTKLNFRTGNSCKRAVIRLRWLAMEIQHKFTTTF